MNYRPGLFFVGVLALLMTAHASATTYTLAGATYDPPSRTGLYSTATGVTGSFTTSSPLAANLTNAKIAGGTGGLGLVTSWSFNDGAFTYTNASSAIWQNDGSNFVVSTNASGVITGFFIVLTMPSSAAAIGQPTEFLFFGFDGPGSVSVVRSICTALLAPGGPCEFYNGAATDLAGTPNGATATFSASALPPPPPPPVTTSSAIPTLSEYGLVLLALMLIATTFHTLRRKTRR